MHPVSRATSTVVGVVMLVGLTVVTASVVGAAVWPTLPEPTPTAQLQLSAEADANRLTVRHVGGDAIDVSEIRLRVRVRDEPLAHQPPVPFFAADGFESGPTGPFNVASEGAWRAGQTATLTLAGTNEPLPDEGDRVTVTVLSDGGVVTRLETTAT